MNPAPVLVTALLLGCTGSIGDRAAVPAPASAAPGAAPPRPAPVATAPTPRCADAPSFRLPALWRLTKAEYARTVVALTGTRADVAGALPDDLASEAGFDNEAEALLVSPVLASRLRDVAEAVAVEVTATPERLRSLTGCDPAGAGCLDGFVRRFGRRAFRRPIPDDERARLAALAAAPAVAGDPAAQAAVIVAAILQSPALLYRHEVGRADPAQPGLLRATGHELAARLSYLVAGTMPSDALLDAADAGRLERADELRAAALAMLDTPQLRAGLDQFPRQWLRVRDVDASPAAGALAPAFVDEHARFVGDFLHAPAAALLDMLVAPYTYVDVKLAKHYGLPAPAAGWHRVDLAGNPQRGGLLTQGAFLVGQGVDEKAAPIKRGVFVRRDLLCSPPPPPPEGVPALPVDAGTRSVRELLAEHQSSPTCSACHRLFDPIGFALERYDVRGVYRTMDANGNPLSGEGELTGISPGAFVGGTALGQRVRAAPEAMSCAVERFYAFATGHAPSQADRCALDALTSAFRAGGASMRELVLAYVTSDAFRTVDPHRGGSR